MPEAAGREWLRYRFPEITPEELEQAVTLCAKPVKDARFEQRRPTNLNERTFVTAAWLAGASYKQLSQVFGVSRQTILERIERTLPKKERNACRLQEPP